MIASLFGTIRSLKLDRATIDVNGVGYLLHITAKSAAKLAIGRDFQVFTSLVVREDAMTLFAFTEAEDRDLFELVQSVSGIGPKVALAITGVMNTDDLARAIEFKDERAIAAIPGIGKKGAQRMILELDGKFAPSIGFNLPTAHSWRDQLVDALTSLGFSKREAELALNDLVAHRGLVELEKMELSQLLKLALSSTKSQKGFE